MGPDFEQFFRQIPAFPIVLLCGSGILLMFSIFFIIRARIIKAQDQTILPGTMPAASSSYNYNPPSSFASTSDLPDLDLLVDMPSPTPPSPATPPARPPRKGTYTLRLEDGGSTEAVEVMTIMRDVVDGGLIIQMGEKAYRSLASDEGFKTGFLKVMRELSPLVKAAPPSATAPTAADEEQPSPVPTEEPPISLRDLVDSSPPPAPPAPPKSYRPPPPARDGTIPGALPRYDIDHQPAPVTKRGLLGRGKLELPPVPELDIAGSIETYLQHKLRYTPEYNERSIHVHPAPDGGVAIEVDGQYFETVGDVTDPEIRDFLTATIQEWQTQK